MEYITFCYPIDSGEIYNLYDPKTNVRRKYPSGVFFVQLDYTFYRKQLMYCIIFTYLDLYLSRPVTQDQKVLNEQQQKRSYFFVTPLLVRPPRKISAGTYGWEELMDAGSEYKE